jgi:hypothetical protein
MIHFIHELLAQLFWLLFCSSSSCPAMEVPTVFSLVSSSFTSDLSRATSICDDDVGEEVNVNNFCNSFSVLRMCTSLVFTLDSSSAIREPILATSVRISVTSAGSVFSSGAAARLFVTDERLAFNNKI